MTAALGIWLVRLEAESIGATLKARLGGEVFRPWRQVEHTPKTQFAAAYREYAQWVLVMATGIAVRFLDGLLQDKRTDPAVVVLDEGCRYAIPLLGGHEGGGNQLAYRVANTVGAVPVITTATEALKPLVVGVGCRKHVLIKHIEGAVIQALGARGIGQVREVATINLKAQEPGLLGFCARHSLPLRVLAHEDLAARGWVSEPSRWVRENLGLDGVCEPCALIASPRGCLVVPKTTVNGVAVAIVEDRL